jgi:hypothetical protein
MSSQHSDARHGGGPSVNRLYHEALSLLENALGLPVDQLEREVDEVERRVSKLRDGLIENLRLDLDADGQSRWRNPLDKVNLALAFIASVAYPSTGIHRSYMEQAKDALSGMEQHFPA